MNPLVSILMPCYNAAPTLPIALASLRAQTYQEWECVFVDDGSTDAPEDVIAAAGDARVRRFRLERNMGRGFARQVALDNARGDFVAMLDADDWVYPWKLERQVQTMSAVPDLALLSTGLAIATPDGELLGVRCARHRAGEGPVVVRPPLKRPGTSLVAFAPSVMRVGAARQLRFAEAYTAGEDADFLVRFVMRHSFAVLAEPMYAYTEAASVTPEKVSVSLRAKRAQFLEFRREYPVCSRVLAAKTSVKAVIYRALSAVGAWDWVIARRFGDPTSEQRQDFEAARDAVVRSALATFDHKMLPESWTSQKLAAQGKV